MSERHKLFLAMNEPRHECSHDLTAAGEGCFIGSGVVNENGLCAFTCGQMIATCDFIKGGRFHSNILRIGSFSSDNHYKLRFQPSQCFPIDAHGLSFTKSGIMLSSALMPRCCLDITLTSPLQLNSLLHTWKRLQ